MSTFNDKIMKFESENSSLKSEILSLKSEISLFKEKHIEIDKEISSLKEKIKQKIEENANNDMVFNFWVIFKCVNYFK